MPLLWRIITNTIIRNPRSYFDVPLKCKIHCYQRPQGRIIQQLRYQSTKAIKLNKLKRTSELKHLIILAAPEKWRIAWGIMFLLVSSAVTMAVPFCLGKIVDIIYTSDKEKMKENLKRLSFILFGVFLIGGVCNCCRVYLMSTAGYRTTQNLRKQVYSAIIHQETAMFDKRSTGELVGRLTGDTQVVSSAITNSISDGLRSFIMTGAGISMMVYVSPQLAVLGLCVVPVVGGVAILYGRFVKNLSKDVQNSLAGLNTLAEEKISNIRTVKFFARESYEMESYTKKIDNLLKLCYKESLYRGIFFGFTGFSGNSIILLTLYYGGVMVSGSTLTAGNLSAFLLYSAYVGISMSGLSSFYNDLNRALGANTRLFELLDRVPTIPIGSGEILHEQLSGDVIFQDISFSYPSKERGSLILKNFHLHLPKNTMTAIVGSSGSGKSTIASLLLRLYDPNQGQILLDNRDLRKLNSVWVKSQIGVVPQEPSLFSGTIRDNISYGKIDASNEEIEEAALRANVTRFANNMPDGLDTRVGERGITLSGGEKQRVAIARALIKKPKILILDEATSALDGESENYVKETLEKATQGRTVLIIAHRLSTVMNANKIVVLDQGRIVESGSYNELLTIDNGFFKKLMQHQNFT